MAPIHCELADVVTLLSMVIQSKLSEGWVGGSLPVCISIFGIVNKFMFSLFLISDQVPGYFEMWITGDNFMAKSYREHFKKAGDDFFMKRNFEIFPQCNSRYSSNNTNLLSRLQITLANAINDRIKLPKYIVIVLDNDLIEFLNYCGFGVASIYGEWIEHLVERFNDLFKQR